MGVFNSDGSVNAGFRYGGGSSAGRFGGWRPSAINWNDLAAKADASVPNPVNPQEQRIAKSFSTLPAQARLDTLNRLKTSAQGGDQGAARKLQYLTPTAATNVPAETTYKPAPTFRNGLVNAVSDWATANIGKPLVEGGQQLTNLSNATSPNARVRAQAQPVDVKKLASDAVITGTNAAFLPDILLKGAGEAAAAYGGKALLKAAGVGAGYGAAGSAAQKFGGGGSALDVLKSAGEGAAGGAVAGGLLHGAGSIIGELRAPGQIKALQQQIAQSQIGGKLHNLQAVLDHYQSIYDENNSRMGQEFAAAEAGRLRDSAANGPLALPANATAVPDAGRVPGGGVIIDPNAPAARVVAQAGKPGVIPTKVEVRPGVPDKTVGVLDSSNSRMAASDVIPGRPAALVTKPGQNVTDIQAKGASPEQVKAAGASLVDQPKGPAASGTGPAAKTDLPTLMKQWDTLQKGGTSPVTNGKAKVTELGVLNSIIEHPDAPPELKLAAMQDRHNLTHNEAKTSIIEQEAKATGVTPNQAAENLATGKGQHSALYQAVDEHQAAGQPQRIAYDYNPNETGGHEPVPQNELHPSARNAFAETLPVAPGDNKSAVNNRRFVSDLYHSLGNQTQKLAKGMAPENIAKLDKIEIPDHTDGSPVTPQEAAQRVQDVANTVTDAKQRQQFLAVVDSMKQNTDTRYAGDVHGLNRDVGYRQNYIPHLYEHEGQVETPHGGGVPGYAKNRIIATRTEAEALAKQTDENGNLLYPGLKLKGNAVEAHVQAMKSAAYEHGNQALARGIESAHPGVEVSNKVNNGYQQLKGTNITVPRGIAPQYNRRLLAPGEKPSLPVRVYDKTNAGLKTSILGAGTFHMLTTAGTTAGQQVARAVTNPLEVPKMVAQNLRLIGGTFSKRAFASNMVDAATSGLKDFATKTGTTLEYNGNLDVARTHIPVISDIHDAVFQRQIPQAKLMIMDQSMQRKFPGMDYRNPTPEQVAWGQRVASAVNNLGGINRAVEGLTPAGAKVLGRVLLAPDYTEGKFRTIGNVWKAGPKGNIARQMVVGKSVLFALPGLIALGAAGKLTNATQWRNAIVGQLADPAVPLGEKGAGSKTNPGGTPQAVHLPTTFISELGKVIKPVVDHLADPAGNPDALSGAKSYASNRLAALPGVASKLVQNKDFYGNPIYGTDKAANSISPAKAALNAGLQVAPIPVVQGAKVATTQEGLRDAALNTAGFRVSNDTTSPESGHSAAVNRSYNAFNTVLAQQTKMSKQVNSLLDKHQINQAHRLAQQWNAQLSAKTRIDPGITNPDAQKAWQAKWKSLQIKTSSRSDATRLRDAKQNAALLK